MKTKLILIFACSKFLLSSACYGVFKSRSSKSCPKINDDHCSTKSLTMGQQYLSELSLGLYKSISEDPSVDQDNFLLLPAELSFIISLIVQGTGADDKQSKHLTEIRCYVKKLTQTLAKTVLADPSKKPKEQGRKWMISERQTFVDKTLKVNETYERTSRCIYKMPIMRVDFGDTKKTQKVVNDWSKKEVEKAVSYIYNESMSNKLVTDHHHVAGDPEVIQFDKAIIATSGIMKIPWKKNLFTKANIKSNQPFYLKPKGTGPLKHAETIVKISTMTTEQKTQLYTGDLFRAAALPLDSSIPSGRVIFILPNIGQSLGALERTLLKNYETLQNFIQEFDDMPQSERKMKISIPKLEIQVTHEWSIPESKNFMSFETKNGFSLKGNEVGVYQDVYLEMNESIEDKMDLNKEKNTTNILSKSKNMKSFKVDRPFLIIVEMYHELIALARIRDPYWCKFCSKKKFHVK